MQDALGEGALGGRNAANSQASLLHCLSHLKRWPQWPGPDATHSTISHLTVKVTYTDMMGFIIQPGTENSNRTRLLQI